MWECSPWKIESRPAASTIGATSRIEIVVSFVIRLAPMRMVELLDGRMTADGASVGPVRRRHRWALPPADTSIVSPEMNELRSDARNSTALEISCGSSQATRIGFIAS